jgi:hypothetical protein
MLSSTPSLAWSITTSFHISLTAAVFVYKRNWSATAHIFPCSYRESERKRETERGRERERERERERFTSVSAA